MTVVVGSPFYSFSRNLLRLSSASISSKRSRFSMLLETGWSLTSSFSLNAAHRFSRALRAHSRQPRYRSKPSNAWSCTTFSNAWSDNGSFIVFHHSASRKLARVWLPCTLTAPAFCPLTAQNAARCCCRIAQSTRPMTGCGHGRDCLVLDAQPFRPMQVATINAHGPIARFRITGKSLESSTNLRRSSHAKIATRPIYTAMQSCRHVF
jgi:hypothetical protein